MLHSYRKIRRQEFILVLHDTGHPLWYSGNSQHHDTKRIIMSRSDVLKDVDTFYRVYPEGGLDDFRSSEKVYWTTMGRREPINEKLQI